MRERETETEREREREREKKIKNERDKLDRPIIVIKPSHRSIDTRHSNKKIVALKVLLYTVPLRRNLITLNTT